MARYTQQSLTIAEVTAGMVATREGSFDAFYECYFPRLYRVSLVMARGNEDLAQDVLQETMLRVIRYIRTFTDEQIFWKWLTRLLRTAFIDEIRKKKIVFPLPPQLTEEAAEEQQKAEWLAWLDEVIDDLNVDERQLVIGKYIEEKSYVALASEFATTAKAIESRLARIRQKMRQKLLEKLADV